MPRLTKRQKHLKKACEVKAAHELEGYNDTDLPIYDEPMENNNAVSIVRKLQEAAKKYY